MVDFTDMERGLERLPDYMRGGMRRYLLQGIPPGDFLTALLSNDLRRTFERGDDVNQLAVLDYLKFLYNHAPSGAWGSADKVKAWIKGGGWEGLSAKDDFATLNG